MAFHAYRTLRFSAAILAGLIMTGTAEAGPAGASQTARNHSDDLVSVFRTGKPVAVQAARPACNLRRAEKVCCRTSQGLNMVPKGECTGEVMMNFFCRKRQRPMQRGVCCRTSRGLKWLSSPAQCGRGRIMPAAKCLAMANKPKMKVCCASMGYSDRVFLSLKFVSREQCGRLRFGRIMPSNYNYCPTTGSYYLICCKRWAGSPAKWMKPDTCKREKGIKVHSCDINSAVDIR